MISIFLGCSPSHHQTDKIAISPEGTFPGADSLKIYYQIKGSGPDTLIVIHGGPGMDSEYMVADFTPLSENHTLLFYDQRGGGRSDLPEDTTLLHIDHHVADLEALRNYFGLDQMTLVAHSFGPMLAAKYALRYPGNVSRMIFLGPIPPMKEDFYAQYGNNLGSRLSEDEINSMIKHNQNLLGGVDVKSSCTSFWNIALKPRLAEGIDVSVVKGDCCAASPEAIRYGMQKTNPTTSGSLGDWDLRPQLAELNIKTLIIHGEEEAIPMAMVEHWASAMPNAELIKVAGAGHFTYVEQPDVVWPAIESFLNDR
ncbi:MAG: alpha/beta hydrolase [Cyclobacteriaceae bacterium]